MPRKSTLRAATALSRLCVLLLTVLLHGVVGRAHAMPMSGVLLDFHTDCIGAELRLPVDRLEIAFGSPLPAPGPGQALSWATGLRSYLLAHLRPSTPDGKPWAVALGALRYDPAPPATIVAEARLTPPAGAPVRQLDFHYDVIVHEIVTHTVVVAACCDWPGGKTSLEPETLGLIRNHVKTLHLNRGPGGAWRGGAAMFALGVRHIAEGTDHLLFLLALLLPAPLLSRAGSWRGHDNLRHSLGRICAIVTAFTIGHSLTLCLGALDWLRLPAQPVEIGVALSIFVSALHALRPVFAGREAVIAGSFGLVHGLAFARTLAELKFTGVQLAWSLAGFNLGIEALQLLVIAVTLPCLVVLSRTATYQAIRIGGAIFAATAAIAWLSERIWNCPNPLTPAADSLARLSPWLLVGLVLLTVHQLLRASRPSKQPD